MPFGDLETIVKARAQETPPVDELYAKASGFVGYHAEHKRRIRTLDAVVNGDWGTVWPDGSVTEAMPKVADFITSDIEDLANLVSEADPTIIVPTDSDRDRDTRSATKRQNILATYRRLNQLSLIRHRLSLDLISTGLCALVVLPDFMTGYPSYIRKDPRHVYPDPDLSSATALTSMVVAYKTKTRVLAAMHPNVSDLFTDKERDEMDTTDLTVYEMYEPGFAVKLAVKPARTSWESARVCQCAFVPNQIGTPFAVIQFRPTVDGQFRGQFDKSIAPLGTANKIMEMHLAQLADEVFAEKIVRGAFDNPEDFGPGATLYTTDPAAAIERAQPAASHPQMYNDVQLLLAQSREAGGVPEARHGNVDQSIASAQFVNAVQGKYITSVSTYQKLIAEMEERANSLALAIDELYLDMPDKQLVGLAGGRSFPGTYTPSKDIKGRYDNRVVYGAGSGLDSYNRRVAITQDVQFGLVSRRTGRAQLDYVGDVIAEEAEIAREQMEAGFLAGLADPSTPLDVRAKAMALAKQGHSVGEIAEAIAADQEAQAQQMSTVQAALGLPPESGPEQGAPLPSLGSLRG